MRKLRTIALVLMSSLHWMSFGQEGSLHTLVEFDSFTYEKPFNQEDRVGRKQILSEHELRFRFRQFKAYAEAEARRDLSDDTRNRFYLKEFWAQYDFSWLDIKLGRQIINWGKTDSTNPTNYFGLIDFRDFLDVENERIGVDALALDAFSGFGRFSLVFTPKFQANPLPELGSRWFFNLPEQGMLDPNSSEGYQFDYAWSAFPEPATTWRNSQWAVRYSHSIGAADFSMSYFNGWNQFPLFSQAVTITGTDRARITIHPNYHKIKALGADFAMIKGPWGIRSEGAYIFTPDTRGIIPEVDDPYFHFVVGVDRNLTKVFGGKNLHVLLEWSLQRPKTGTQYQKQDLAHIMEKGLACRLNLELGGQSEITAELFYNLEKQDYVARTILELGLNDYFQMDFAMDLLGGPKDTFFGDFNHNQRFQIRGKWHLPSIKTSR